jgi:hypothetical protein
MHNQHKHLILLAVFTLFLISSSSSYAQKSQSLKTEITAIIASTQSVEADTGRLFQSLNEISEKIGSLKDIQDKSYNLFRQFELEATLKKAKTISDRISELGLQKSKLERTLKEKRKELFTEYNSEIDQLLVRAKKEPSRKMELLPQLKILLVERSSLAQFLSPSYRTGLESLELNPEDSPQEIYSKASILEDYRDRLSKELSLVEERLSTLKRQTYAMNEMGHLLEEEDFFTETSFLKSVDKLGNGTKKETASARTGIEVAGTSQSESGSKDLSATPAPAAIGASSSLTSDAAQPSGAKNIVPGSEINLVGRSSLSDSANEDSTKKKSKLNPREDSDTKGAQPVQNLSIQSQIEFLEQERTGILNIIKEIDLKRSSMEIEAAKSNVMKVQ